MEPEHKMGAIDILHCMNLFHLCGINPQFSNFLDLKWQNVQYIKDANLMSPADYILLNDNMKGMKILFDMVLGYKYRGKVLKMDLDKGLLFHGLVKYQEWLQERAEKDMMMVPKSWDGMPNPIFGEFKQNKFMQLFNPIDRVIFLSSSKLISREQIKEYIYIDDQTTNKQEI